MEDKLTNKKEEVTIGIPKGVLLSALLNRWRSRVREQLERIGLTYPRFLVLFYLNDLSKEYEHVTQTMIAEASDMDKMTVSQLLKTLQQRGMIIKENHPKKVRSNSISLTEKGRLYLERGYTLLIRVDNRFFKSIVLGKQTELSILEFLNKSD